MKLGAGLGRVVIEDSAGSKLVLCVKDEVLNDDVRFSEYLQGRAARLWAVWRADRARELTR